MGTSIRERIFELNDENTDRELLDKIYEKSREKKVRSKHGIYVMYSKGSRKVTKKVYNIQDAIKLAICKMTATVIRNGKELEYGVLDKDKAYYIIGNTNKLRTVNI